MIYIILPLPDSLGVYCCFFLFPIQALYLQLGVGRGVSFGSLLFLNLDVNTNFINDDVNQISLTSVPISIALKVFDCRSTTGKYVLSEYIPSYFLLYYPEFFCMASKTRLAVAYFEYKCSSDGFFYVIVWCNQCVLFLLSNKCYSYTIFITQPVKIYWRSFVSLK